MVRCLLPKNGRPGPFEDRALHLIHRAFYTSIGPREVYRILHSNGFGEPRSRNRRGHAGIGGSGAGPTMLPLIQSHILAFVEQNGDRGYWKIRRDEDRTRVDYFRFSAWRAGSRRVLEEEADDFVGRLRRRLEQIGKP